MKLLALLLLFPILSLAQPQRGIMLGDLTWQQAEKILTPETIVVIPLGAEAKEHGPHLLLKNDLILAEYFQQRVLQEANVVMAPMINYHFYPSFLEYPGSTSLRLSTARDLVVDICRSLAYYGPKKFYILNTGISTVRALNPARDTLAAEGIIMQFTDLNSISELEKKISKQEGGSSCR
jgi:creatinine amidohydrolase